jgi:hypothetical protein
VPEHKRVKRMRNRKDREVEIPPEDVPALPDPTIPCKDTQDATTVKWTLKPLKNCGDCEPGGFGSTYGFGPR